MPNHQLTHLKRNKPAMVDICDKLPTLRVARAQARVAVGAEIAACFGEQDVISPKGPVFHTAIIAGTMAAKNTAGIIPFCHSLALSRVDFNIALQDHTIIIDCEVATHGPTGVEMEALTGASVAALTIYDMCKSVSTDMVISETLLIYKTGGKGGLPKA
jgi:cyclic pyranopterin phosphate synthase